ncbi:hypothetical protein [Microbacterium galbinum]|uniref:hypothetical protein n=1 Tax=Microbacterium galbinum TaxID=2851646 RepID=UPI001FFC52B7|nr:hypothetical protein [Microbacterium galbinum]
MHQRVFERRQSKNRRPLEPMADTVASGVMDASVLSEPHMQARIIIEHPDPVHPQRRRAGERSSVSSSGDEFRGGAISREHPSPHAHDSPVANGSRNVEPCQTETMQEGAAGDSAAVVDHMCRREHPTIVTDLDEQPSALPPRARRTLVAAP